jgi:hypothetical protein
MATFENAPLPPEMLRGSLTSTPEERERHQLIRRKVLIAGGLATAAVLLPIRLGLDWYTADECINDLAYPGTGSPITTLGYDNMPADELPHIPEAANVYAGLGQRPDIARKMATKLADAPYKGRRLSYTEYAGQGLDMDDLTNEYEALEGTLDEMHVFCNSMGSITWASIMGNKYQRLRQAQANRSASYAGNQLNPYSPKHIKTLTFCGSPFDVDDTYQANVVKVISELGMSGTLTEKFLAKLVLAVGSEKKYHGFKHMLETVADATFDELPPKMWASQACQLGTTAIDTFAGSFGGAITRDTLVMYLRPRDSRGDTVVKIDQASSRIGRFFTQTFGCQYQEILMKDAGHADIDKVCVCPEFEDLLNANSGYKI